MSSALLIIANPTPASFSHAMSEAAGEVLERRGYELERHDLYAERFDPVQPTGESRISSDPLVEAHCRDLQAAGDPQGLGAGVVFNTSNTPPERVAAMFGLCGVTAFERRMFGPIATSGAQERYA